VRRLDWLKPDWRPGARTLVSIAAVAVAIKVVLLFVLLPYLNKASPTSYQADRFPDWYDFLAITIAEGHGYRFFADTTETMLRTPGWPLVLAGLFSVFGYGLTAVKVFNVLCSVGTGVLTFALGKRVTRNHLVAMAAALIYFLHPAVVIADSRGGLESLFMLFMMLFVFLVYRAFDSNRLLPYIGAGAILGVTLLIKSTVVLFIPCVFLCLALSERSFAGLRHAVLASGVLALTAGLVLTPWIVRNYRLSGEFVPTMTVGGMAAYTGYYRVKNLPTGREPFVVDEEASHEMQKYATSMNLRFKPGYYPQFYSVADESRYYRYLGTVVRQHYREDPAFLLKVLAYNAKGFWIGARTAKATVFNMVLVLPVLAMSAVGAWLGWRRRLPVLPIVVFIGAFYLPHLPILGQARYHVPLIPLLAILVGSILLPWLLPPRARS
jgi:4-amino-4-deoxy-L-arabinose transferase-like glycosyltransferase